MNLTKVGAVALDLAGNVASATSTGGITGKRGGRVMIVITINACRRHHYRHCEKFNLRHNLILIEGRGLSPCGVGRLCGQSVKRF